MHHLLDAICLQKKIQPVKGSTLLFIDEIQNSPTAVQLLRYFYEEIPWLHVIAAGSLLESLFAKDISFPVGRVEFMAVQWEGSNSWLSGHVPLLSFSWHLMIIKAIS